MPCELKGINRRRCHVRTLRRGHRRPDWHQIRSVPLCTRHMPSSGRRVLLKVAGNSSSGLQSGICLKFGFLCQCTDCKSCPLISCKSHYSTLKAGSEDMQDYPPTHTLLNGVFGSGSRVALKSKHAASFGTQDLASFIESRKSDFFWAASTSSASLLPTSGAIRGECWCGWMMAARNGGAEQSGMFFLDSNP
jgi:hypothetical protein